jgi:hypothetical protein
MAIKTFFDTLFGPEEIKTRNPFYDRKPLVDNFPKTAIANDFTNYTFFCFLDVLRHGKYLEFEECLPSKRVFKEWAKSLGFPDSVSKTVDIEEYCHPEWITHKARTDFISGALAAIDLIEVARLNPGKEVFQPSMLGESVARFWEEFDPKTYHEIMRRNKVTPPMMVAKIGDLQSTDPKEMAAIARTWFSACQLDSVFCAGPKFLPNLFVTDQRQRNVLPEEFTNPRNPNAFEYDQKAHQLKIVFPGGKTRAVPAADPKHLVEMLLLEKRDFDRHAAAVNAVDALRRTNLCDDPPKIAKSMDSSGGRYNLNSQLLRQWG